MTLGFQRLNERQKRPNEHIDFIKPDPSASKEDQAIAEHFLSKIAAQCFPVMKKHHLYVRSLEEYETNPEFLGRNFNAGECIQLVLKDKRGRWLNFRFVQMVMMHELAHCKQMNHSRYFWNVRNDYSKQMEDLWKQGYEGDGIWGRGQNLTNGRFVPNRMPEGIELPEHLCGGAYRRARGKKRKRGLNDADSRSQLTYAERQQKRIARKFGKHGEGAELGEDELVRGALEASSGKRQTGKPRVANSKRGRDLRAAAALARFEAAKAKTPELQVNEEDEDESEWTSEEDASASDSITLTKNAGRLQDQHGNDMINVCGEDGEDERAGQREMEELLILSGQPRDSPSTTPRTTRLNLDTWPEEANEQSKMESEGAKVRTDASREDDSVDLPPSTLSMNGNNSAVQRKYTQDAQLDPPNGQDLSESPTDPAAEPRSSFSTCAICSLENDGTSPICMACSHVLKPALVHNSWRCKSATCARSKYTNAGDVGRCGLCGSLKPKQDDTRMIGMTSNDVLRWD